MRSCDGTCIETKDRIYQPRMRVGHRYVPGESVEAPRFPSRDSGFGFGDLLVVVQLHAERLLHRLHGAAQYQRAPRQTRRCLVHRQTMQMSELAERLEAGWIGGIFLVELFAGYPSPPQLTHAQRILPLHDQRYADDLLRIGGANVAGVRWSNSFGLGQRYTLLGGGTHA